MSNPYESPTPPRPHSSPRRSVFAFIAVACPFAICTYTFLSTGLRMLNQELNLFPWSYGIYDFEVNGYVFSNRSYVVVSLAVGTLSGAIALALLLRARHNYKHNSALGKPYTSR